jgi:hypothetical protein
MSDFTSHAFPKARPETVTADAVQARIARTRARAVRRQKALLVCPEGEGIAAMIARELESELERVDRRYSPILREAGRRRADLKCEARALSSKIREAEARRLREESIATELADHRDEFESSRRRIEESLSALRAEPRLTANESANASDP